jgi:hypothetical protein
MYLYVSTSSESQEYTPKKNAKQSVHKPALETIQSINIYTPNKDINAKTSSSSDLETQKKGVVNIAPSRCHVYTPKKTRARPNTSASMALDHTSTSSQDDLLHGHITTPKRRLNVVSSSSSPQKSTSKNSVRTLSSHTKIRTPKKSFNEGGSSTRENSTCEVTPRNQKTRTKTYEKGESKNGREVSRAYSAPARVQRRGQLEAHTSTPRAPNVLGKLDFELIDAAEDAGVDTSDPEYVHVRIRKSVFEEMKLRQDSSRTRFTKHITAKFGTERVLTKRQKNKKIKKKDPLKNICPRYIYARAQYTNVYYTQAHPSTFTIHNIP